MCVINITKAKGSAIAFSKTLIQFQNVEIAALKEVRKVKSIQIFRKPAQQAIQGMVVRVVEFSSEGSIFYVKNHQNFSYFFFH